MVEEPGLLKVRRMAWKPEKTDSVFYSATDETTGEIVVGQDSILHILPGGQRETWRIVEWTFDPFTAVSAADEKGSSRSSSPTQARSASSAKEEAEEEGAQEQAASEAESEAAGRGKEASADAAERRSRSTSKHKQDKKSKDQAADKEEIAEVATEKS